MEQPAPNDPGRVGHYRVVALLGSGGMGRVYLGLDPSGSPAAVKVVRAEYAYDPGFRERFARELELAQRVHGNYTPRVLAADTSGQTPWLATEYVVGPSLQDLVQDTGPLPEHAVRLMGRGIAQALERVHATGLVHRDLKPGNVMVSAAGPQVIDFGIARALEDASGAEEERIIGTPGYMAPESVDGRESGAAADVFALGGVLVHALTGGGPFGDGHPSAVLYRISNLEPDLDGVPASLRGIITACLEKDPTRRPNAAQVLQALGGPTAPAGSAAAWLPPAAAGRIDGVAHEYEEAVRAAGVGDGRGTFGRGLLIVGAAALALTMVGGLGVWAAGDAGLIGSGADTASEEAPGVPDREACSPTEHLAPEYTEAANEETTVPQDEAGIFYTGFSNDGEVLAVAGTGGVALWDWREQEELALIETEIAPMYGHPVFSPDDCMLAYASDDGAYVYSLESGEVTVLSEGWEVGAVAFTPDSEQLVVGNKYYQVDSGVFVYDLETGELVTTYTGSASTVLSVAVSPDGRHIAAQDLLEHSTVWDTETGESVATGEEIPSTNPTALSFVDEETLVYPVAEGVQTQNVVSDPEQGTAFVTEDLDDDLVLHDFEYSVVADRVYATFLPDDFDPAGGIMKIWEYSTGEELTAEADEGFLWEISVHPQGEVIIGVPATGNGMWVVDAREMRIIERL
ncbi:serine/threonine-protein kinase [Nocardiopsis sp. L17-MgMaSL7]|uniref:serine/threonine-protein kinase n=1 Tax=Nocardiopsis sp. L17-MgMaSL7 TaxID=1938893 RepID=UPI000D71848E|nr:serine/threonine-protein kinase [Nocardiopsis sp. L17-MgMaSL7]PWV45519.1 serine/threonine protein kinase [Nocardiopsis sp. L17-MgMaSL7]